MNLQRTEEPAPRQQPHRQMPTMRCWEYMSDRGALRDECKRCAVYRLGVAPCFLIAEKESDTGHAGRFCRTSCQDCAYYRRVKGLATRVLVITSDPGVMNRLTGEENESIAIRLASNAYDASAIMRDFHPAFAVIDERVLTRESGLLESLAGDPRAPGLRIILLVARNRTEGKRVKMKNSLIHGIIEKPITFRQIANKVDRFPVAGGKQAVSQD